MLKQLTKSHSEVTILLQQIIFTYKKKLMISSLQKNQQRRNGSVWFGQMTRDLFTNLISDNDLFWYSIASFHQSERRASCDICAPVIALAIHIRDCTIQKFIFSRADIKSSITLIKSYVYQKNIFLCWMTDITRNINYLGLAIITFFYHYGCQKQVK